MARKEETCEDVRKSPIEDDVECRVAVPDLKMLCKDIPGDVSITVTNRFPNGCYANIQKWSRNYGIYFNEPPNEVGSTSDNIRQVCKPKPGLFP